MASSWVPEGGVLHWRRGTRPAPSHVNSRGNLCPARSGLETVSEEECPVAARHTDLVTHVRYRVLH
jgi:hypothetical protein